jgi:GNAT superfamily N-acetyltransferase
MGGVNVNTDKQVDDILQHFGVLGMKWGVRSQVKSGYHSENRKIKKTDFEEVNKLLNGLSSQDKKFLALDQKLTLIKRNIRDEKHCSVATVGDKIVGFLRESGRPKGFVLLEELVIDPNYRGKGIASKMLDDFNKEYPKTLVKTKADNKEMKSLLEKSGYNADNPNSKMVINWIRDNPKTKKEKSADTAVLNDMLAEEIQHGGDIMAEIDANLCKQVDDILQHFGVLGMKWGKRTKSRGQSSEDHKNKMTLKSKNVHELSNEQLRTLTNRLQLEKQLRDLNPNHVKKGLNIVKNITTAGTTIAGLYALSKTPLAQATFKGIQKAVITATLAAKIR